MFSSKRQNFNLGYHDEYKIPWRQESKITIGRLWAVLKRHSSSFQNKGMTPDRLATETYNIISEGLIAHFLQRKNWHLPMQVKRKSGVISSSQVRDSVQLLNEGELES